MRKLGIGIGFGLLLSFSQLYSPYSWGQEVWRIEQPIGKVVTKIGGSEQQISLDLPTLGTLELGDTIDLDIPGKGFVPAIVDSKHKNQNGSFSLRARMQKHSGALILTYDMKSAYGYLEYGDEVYKLKVDENGGQLKKRLEGAFAEPELTRFIPEAREIILASKKAQSAAALKKASMSDEVASLDILALYTKEAAEAYGSNPLTRIDQMFAVTNFLLEESGVKITVNLVHSEEIDAPELPQHLVGIFNQRFAHNVAPWFDHVPNLRYEHGADFVALLTIAGGGDAALCGTHGTTIGCGPSRYFRVGLTDDRTSSGADDIFAHEFGHSMGLSHARAGGRWRHFSFCLGVPLRRWSYWHDHDT
jgi:hypothetical protein